MQRKCFISFKTEDEYYKKTIQQDDRFDIIDKSLNEAIQSEDDEYIMRVIREQYLSDSTVTIHLIGTRSAENLGKEEQKYIKRELQASLYDGTSNTRNGILGVVLPEMYESVYKGSTICGCGSNINCVHVNDNTTVAEFHKNYYIKDSCHHGEDDRYCVLVKWEDFYKNPNNYIEEAFNKREHPTAEKITVYP